MKKLFQLVTTICCIYFLSSNQAFSQAQHRLVIKVISEDRKEPIEDASVIIDLKNQHFSDHKVEKTDWEGMVYREYYANGVITINAEAAGYYGSIRQVEIKPKDPAGDVKVVLMLKRKENVKLVVVDVFEIKTGAPVYEAQVKLKGDIYSFSGTTNSMGQAVIPVDKNDNYAITISRTGYMPITENLTINDNNKEYSLTVDMAPTRSFSPTMRVKVVRKYEDGEYMSVPYANVIYSYENTSFEHNADEDGISEFTHSIPIGESVTITVKMGGFKTQSKVITIKTNGTSGNNVDGALFSLVSDEKVINAMDLNVEVMDDKTYDPVKGANVKVKISDGTILEHTTNQKGESVFPGINVSRKDLTARVEVKKEGYKEKWSEISNDLMNGNDKGERRFVVYISKKDETNDWNGVFKDAYSTFSFSGGTGSVSASWTYTVGDSKGTGSLKSTRVDGNSASGTWSAQHEDNTKTGTRKGTFTISISGDTISGELLEDTPSWNYKTGYSAANVNSSMHKGSVWSINVSRKSN